MRRIGARPLKAALDRVVMDCAPATTLARAQRCWPEVAGSGVAAESTPRSERDGILTVACDSAVWAAELALLSSDLLERLNTALGTPGGPAPVRELKFVTGATSGGRRRLP